MLLIFIFRKILKVSDLQTGPCQHLVRLQVSFLQVYELNIEEKLNVPILKDTGNLTDYLYILYRLSTCNRTPKIAC